MSRFSDEFIGYMIAYKSDEVIYNTLNADSFRLVCDMADAINDGTLTLPERYCDRVMNIAKIFLATRNRSKK